MKVLFCNKSSTYFVLGKSKNRFGETVLFNGMGETRQLAITDAVINFNKLEY